MLACCRADLTHKPLKLQSLFVLKATPRWRAARALEPSRALFACSRYPGLPMAEVADGHANEWRRVSATSYVVVQSSYEL
jgi:hypothetical protein